MLILHWQHKRNISDMMKQDTENTWTDLMFAYLNLINAQRFESHCKRAKQHSYNADHADYVDSDGGILFESQPLRWAVFCSTWLIMMITHIVYLIMETETGTELQLYNLDDHSVKWLTNRTEQEENTCNTLNLLNVGLNLLYEDDIFTLFFVSGSSRPVKDKENIIKTVNSRKSEVRLNNIVS